MAIAPDRLERLWNQTRVTGIDFVFVHEDQVTLDVHFHKPPGELVPPLGDIAPEQVRISRREQDGRETVVPVGSVRWDHLSPLGMRKVLHVRTKRPGDYASYRLHIDHPQMDFYYNDVDFSFKAHCHTKIDCTPLPHECPQEEPVDFPVDYQARDFWSLRRALMDFAAQRYPHWMDRGREADVAVMLAEVISAMGDELAYYQDRVAREAYLETATQRRSLRRHARLVDYTVHDGLGARSWLDVTVKEGKRGEIPAGFPLWAAADDGGKVPFEVGRNLAEMREDEYDADVLAGRALKGRKYGVDAGRNSFQPHIWNEDDTCLPVGTTEVYIRGQHRSRIPLDDAPEGAPAAGKWMLLRTSPTDPSVPARRWMVRVVDVTDTDGDGNPLEDPLVQDPETGQPVALTRLVWEREQALPFEVDLEVLEIRGNLIPAVAGRTSDKRFVIRDLSEGSGIPEEETRGMGRAVERRVPEDAVTYLFSLPETEEEGLVWSGDDVLSARPEISLCEERFEEVNGDGLGKAWISETDARTPCDQNPGQWCWRRSLLGVRSSQSHDRDFTLDDGQWGRVVGYRRVGEEVVHMDYRSNGGVSLRFGDGEFGCIPRAGSVFKAVYRTGNGERGNVAADTIRFFEEGSEVVDSGADPSGTLATAADLIESVTNPLPADNGLDAETAEQARQLAPQAFRNFSYRAVKREDYAEAAERLPWVQRAGATLRWTGSWLSYFVTPDPLGAVTLSPRQRLELGAQLDRFRQAGKEAHILDPCYADLDLVIRVCVDSSAYGGQVRERVMQVLTGRKGVNPRPGFFSPDNFTFGVALERSVLESVIQAVPGVRAVMDMRIARRGWFKERPFTEASYGVGPHEVIRVENDPNHSDRGSVKLRMEGGA